MIHFVTATISEARPLIEEYKLKKDINSNNFQLFCSEKYSLIVSGIGKINSALSVSHTFFKLNQKLNNIWINIGIAGHINEKIGKLILVNKVIDNESNKSFYPFFSRNYSLKQIACTTYDKPNFDYNISMSDMELSGFFHSASKYSSKELIHSLKIISDNINKKIDFKDKKVVQDLIRMNVPKIKKFVSTIEIIHRKFFLLDEKVNKRIKDDLKMFKYTFSEKIQLSKLLYIIYHNNFSNKKILNYSNDINSNIKNLKRMLNL